jgi:hypothetical protein
MFAWQARGMEKSRRFRTLIPFLEANNLDGLKAHHNTLPDDFSSDVVNKLFTMAGARGNVAFMDYLSSLTLRASYVTIVNPRRVKGGGLHAAFQAAAEACQTTTLTWLVRRYHIGAIYSDVSLVAHAHVPAEQRQAAILAIVEMDDVEEHVRCAIIRNDMVVLDLCLKVFGAPKCLADPSLFDMIIHIHNGSVTMADVLTIDRLRSPELFSRLPLGYWVLVSMASTRNINTTVWARCQAFVTVCDGRGVYPIHCVDTSYHPTPLEAMLALGALINQQTNDGTTLLMMAVAAGAPLAVLRELLSRGADALIISSSGMRAVDMVAESHYSYEERRNLLYHDYVSAIGMYHVMRALALTDAVKRKDAIVANRAVGGRAVSPGLVTSFLKRDQRGEDGVVVTTTAGIVQSFFLLTEDLRGKVEELVVSDEQMKYLCTRQQFALQ